MNSDGKETIKKYMTEDEHKLNFEPKAICDYWWNILDPRLNHTPYSEEEKNHIYEWASKYQENGNIQWKLLQVKQLEAKSSNLKKEDDKNEGECECEDELKYDKTDVEYVIDSIEDKRKHTIQFLINKSV
ncbi:uncharacterized protein OCT59_003575 [Rhizophagus irregularis]|uniref:uncharacterized protein n=1 Tax=Rhizophagus irregularis TaxID=588596 RepID=UPI001A0B3C6D|nr:hypothetical protein OCT59_003575 [Rhizophagus irregularis]GBC37565.2 hypothetical protein GLOIN_2v1881065 [Rhizophagus irregularis DAOM 181602=DAOM 197198]